MCPNAAFFHVPVPAAERTAWCDALQVPPSRRGVLDIRVCGCHFGDKALTVSGRGVPRKRLVRGARPVLVLPPTERAAVVAAAAAASRVAAAAAGGRAGGGGVGDGGEGAVETGGAGDGVGAGVGGGGGGHLAVHGLGGGGGATVGPDGGSS